MTKPSQYHVHIAFPDSLNDACTHFAAKHPSWHASVVGDVYFPKDPTLHEKHMVRGSCQVLTIKPEKLNSALTAAISCCDFLPAQDQIRLEIEQILSINGQSLAHESIAIGECPTFESHIIVQHSSGASIHQDRLDKIAESIGIQFDMFDLMSADTKATITTYYADSAMMALETEANAQRLRDALSFEAIINTKFERVLFSGPLDTFPDWLRKHGVPTDLKDTISSEAGQP